jgi:hypothetical protein
VLARRNGRCFKINKNMRMFYGGKKGRLNTQTDGFPAAP